MTLLIDVTTAQHARGGIGVVVNGLLGALQDRDDVDVTVIAGPHTETGHLDTWRPPFVSATPARIAFQRLALPAVAELGSRRFGAVDRLLLLDSYIPQWRWPGSGIRLETFVHDVLPLTHPAYFSRRRDAAKRLALEAIRRERPRVFTSCQFTADEISRNLGIEADIAEFGCGQLTDARADSLLSEPPGGRGDYLLYIGAFEARKDLRTLVEAFAAVASESPGLKLGVIGSTTAPGAAEFRAWAKAEAGPAIRFLGRRSSEQTLDLVARAGALVYPSLAEGFGLPVLEGMAIGTPVIATDIPAIRTWAADGPRYFAAGDPAALAEAIRETLRSDPRPRILRGKAIAAQYRWSRFAERLVAGPAASNAERFAA